MAEYKNITAVPLKSEPAKTENVIVEDNGVAKRIPFSKVGGGGAGVDLVITAKGVPSNDDEGSGDSAEEIYILMSDIVVTTELSFDELFAKWLTFTCNIAVDCSDLGYTGALGAKLHLRTYSLVPYDIMTIPSASEEVVSTFAEMGVTINVGDKLIAFQTEFNSPYCYDEEGNEYELECYNMIILTKGTSGQIVCTAVEAG